MVQNFREPLYAYQVHHQKYNSIALNLYYLPKQLYPSNYLKNVASSLLIKLCFIYLSDSDLVMIIKERKVQWLTTNIRESLFL